MYKRLHILILIFSRITDVNAQFYGGDYYCDFTSANHAAEVHSTLKNSDFVNFISTIEPGDSSWFEFMIKGDNIGESLYVWHKIKHRTILYSKNSYSIFKDEIELLKRKIIYNSYGVITRWAEGGIFDFYVHPPFTPYYTERIKKLIYWKKVGNWQGAYSHLPSNGWFGGECNGGEYFLLGEPVIPNDSLTEINDPPCCDDDAILKWNLKYSKRKYPVLLVEPKDIFWSLSANEPNDFGVCFTEAQWDLLHTVDSLGYNPYFAYFKISNFEFGDWILTDNQMCGESIPISYAQMEELDPSFSKHKEILEDLYSAWRIAPPPPPAAPPGSNIVDEVNAYEVYNFVNVENKPIFAGCQGLATED